MLPIISIVLVEKNEGTKRHSTWVVFFFGSRRGRRAAAPAQETEPGERSGGFQQQDASPHPHPAAQRPSGQPGQEEPQEEGGGGHRRCHLLAV